MSYCMSKCLISVFVVQSLSRVQLFVTPWTAACQASLTFTISQSLLKLMSIESVMPSNHPTISFLCKNIYSWVNAFFLSILFIYLFGGLVGHTGSSLHLVESFAEAHRLFSCGAQASVVAAHGLTFPLA